ncbi:hypothetical protein LTR85_010185 [Meristemomyces frigidus]|nr:hypothetical protein LTR85_010185 [Meristemomyces frigidus]
MPPKSKQLKKQAVPAASDSIKQQQRAPSWPVLHPLIPTSDLQLVPLLQDHILTIPRFWTASLCKTYVTFLSALPLVTTPGKPKKGDAVRVNDRYQIDDPAFAERLWSGTALKQLVEGAVVGAEAMTEDAKRALWGGEVLGLNRNIRIYRYSKGQFFDQHCTYHHSPLQSHLLSADTVGKDDDANNVKFPSAIAPSAIAAKTTWTLLLYLTSPATGCKGGETVFYLDPPSKREAAPPPVIAELEVGMALLHRHGVDCMLHEGREVTEGEKWVIRSDLCVKR